MLRKCQKCIEVFKDLTADGGAQLNFWSYSPPKEPLVTPSVLSSSISNMAVKACIIILGENEVICEAL